MTHRSAFKKNIMQKQSTFRSEQSYQRYKILHKLIRLEISHLICSFGQTIVHGHFVRHATLYHPRLCPIIFQNVQKTRLRKHVHVHSHAT
jgi:serine kinase of HPr protein (carbohydrate metabolism regulator)